MLFLSKNNRVIAYHILFWMSYMALGGLMDFARNPKHFSFNILDMFFTQLPNMAVFYLCLVIFYKLFSPFRIALFSFLILCSYGMAILLWLLNTYIISALIHANEIGSSKAPIDIFRFCIEVLWLFIIYAFFAFGYYYLNKSIQHQKQLRLIEKEKHHAEYAFLRAQINPHFLNNTLNFFYAKSLPLSTELANGIMTLSEIMRYSLEIDQDDQTTLLDREIEHIKNLIDINQLRFNHELQIDFRVDGDTCHVNIIPLVLITIVENALKHGDCSDELNPVKIYLEISPDQHYLYLKTHNMKKEIPKEPSSGIGMENIRRRLGHQYGTCFTLSILETETDYTIELNHPIIERSTGITSNRVL